MTEYVIGIFYPNGRIPWLTKKIQFASPHLPYLAQYPHKVLQEVVRDVVFPALKGEWPTPIRESLQKWHPDQQPSIMEVYEPIPKPELKRILPPKLPEAPPPRLKSWKTDFGPLPKRRPLDLQTSRKRTC
jgi:hypothetical protein